MTTHRKEFHHPFVVRLTHWVNVVAFAIMVSSGLRIYNASPLFDFRVPEALTLGGWLAGARQWHFFAMWLFAVNGVLWVAHTILTRHGRRTTLFRPGDARGIVPMILYYLRVRKDHPPQGKYNALQKLAYSTVPAAAILALATGIAIYWPVQLSGLTAVFGGYDAARIWHFGAMAALLLFLAGHLVMVLAAGWWNFWSMVTGWKRFRA
jgi:thiosulfate reductase cytochrome b subunit